MKDRVRPGPVPGCGPNWSKTGPDRSRIFFWTSAGSCAAFLSNYVQGREGRAAVWQIVKCRACVCWPLLSVGLTAREGARHGAVGRRA